MQYTQKENATSALANFDFAIGMMAASGIGTNVQLQCLSDSVSVLREMTAGAVQMQNNEDCGGDGWWNGWERIKATLLEN